MKLSEFKQNLTFTNEIHFILPTGHFIPKHFHITEAGLVTKNFVDCGGTIRADKSVTFQLWVSKDYDHRLEADKILKIISLFEQKFTKEDLEIQIEYQTDTIALYGLDFQDGLFLLTSKHTDCLAKDNCGVSCESDELELAEQKFSSIKTKGASSCCSPGGGCC